MGKYSIPGVDYVAKKVYVEEAPQPRSRELYNRVREKVIQLSQTMLFLVLPWLIGFGLLMAVFVGQYVLAMLLAPERFNWTWFVLISAAERALDYGFVAGIVVAVLMFLGARR